MKNPNVNDLTTTIPELEIFPNSLIDVKSPSKKVELDDQGFIKTEKD